MTRRERLEAKAERRTEWAEKAATRSAAAFDRASAIADGIPFGQPILVGHHSEAGHRRDLDRIQSGMRTGCDEASKVAHHEEKARGLERQLRTSIFSDDEDAIPALEAKVAALEAQRARIKGMNAAIRKAMKAGLPEGWLDGVTTDPEERESIVNNVRYHWKQEQQERQQAANVSPSGIAIEGDEYITLNEILDTLKAAGFRWASGSWVRRRESLVLREAGPAYVADLVSTTGSGAIKSTSGE